MALAVKVPLTFWLVVAAPRGVGATDPVGRAATGCSRPTAVAFLAIASVGSSRNLGVRYLLPLAPLAIVWVSGLAEGQTLGRGGSPGAAWPAQASRSRRSTRTS